MYLEVMGIDIGYEFPTDSTWKISAKGCCRVVERIAWADGRLPTKLESVLGQRNIYGSLFYTQSFLGAFKSRGLYVFF